MDCFKDNYGNTICKGDNKIKVMDNEELQKMIDGYIYLGKFVGNDKKVYNIHEDFDLFFKTFLPRILGIQGKIFNNVK
jgi:hypothetical protein